MLTRIQLTTIDVIETSCETLSGCLVLTQCGQHLTGIVCADVALDQRGVVLRDNHVVRFVDNGWSVKPADELLVVRDGAEVGICDPDQRLWVPNHSLMPYRLVDLSPTEHTRLVDHIRKPRPWDLFKYIQLVYLGEDGFGGGRDALVGPDGYGTVIRTDRWYGFAD